MASSPSDAAGAVGRRRHSRSVPARRPPTRRYSGAELFGYSVLSSRPQGCVACVHVDNGQLAASVQVSAQLGRLCRSTIERRACLVHAINGSGGISMRAIQIVGDAEAFQTDRAGSGPKEESLDGSLIPAPRGTALSEPWRSHAHWHDCWPAKLSGPRFIEDTEGISSSPIARVPPRPDPRSTANETLAESLTPMCSTTVRKANSTRSGWFIKTPLKLPSELSASSCWMTKRSISRLPFAVVGRDRAWNVSR